MLLPCAQLKRWKGWTPEARQFLGTNAPAFDIRQPIRDYGELIEDLYHWFYEEYERQRQPSI
jgi:hypothetical protein